MAGRASAAAYACVCHGFACNQNLWIRAGYWAFSNASDKLGIKKTARKTRKGTDKVAAFDEDEWVKGTLYDVDRRRRAAAAAKKQ